jgi:flavodoxin
MKVIVVYYSKTGNTKNVAELIANNLGCISYPVNLQDKKGRGTKEERDKEKELYNKALQESIDCDLVIIGTPTSFQKPKSMIQRYVRDVQTQTAALFCTYNNKVGSTLIDLENTLLERGIKVVQKLSIGGFKSVESKDEKEPIGEENAMKISSFTESLNHYLIQY